MAFGDVKTTIGEKGLVSILGEKSFTVGVPTNFSENISITGSLSVSGSVDVTGSLNVSSDLAISGGLNLANSWFMITSPEDFPTASGGVITLQDNGTYVVTREIDLSGSRLVLGQNTTILGGSSENCRLKSTGLTGSALISSAWSPPIRNITLEADTALNLDATGNSNQAIDWFGVNFTDCREIGLIKNYNNFIMNNSAFLNSAGMRFDGTINTIAFDTCLFVGTPSSSSIILPSSLTVGRRFRIIYSSLVDLGGSIGIQVENENATFEINDSLILDTINFSGPGTHVSGSSAASNKAYFVNCVGVENSADIAQYFMNNNALVTGTPTRNEFYKISGSTSPGSYVRKFNLSDNRATYVGSRSGFYLVSSVSSFNDGANQEIAFRIGLNGQTISSTESKANTGAGGRAESVTVQGVVFLSSGSYVEIFAANNTSGGGSLTVTEQNVIITRISS